MSQIKAIETVYNGYRFRSRLEARWAVFFDACKVKWEYEPDGFEFEDGTLYLPDFFLPDLDSYVEIKPVGAINITMSDGYANFEDGTDQSKKYRIAAKEISKEHFYIIFFGDPLDALIRNDRDIGANGENFLFYTGECLGKIYSSQYRNLTCQSGKKCAYCEQSKFLCSYNICALSPKEIIVFNMDAELQVIPVKCENICLILNKGNHLEYYSKHYNEKEIDGYIMKNMKAMKVSRQARFEHGEKPAI